MAKHLSILIACHTAKVPVLYLSPQQQAGMSKAHLITENKVSLYVCSYFMALADTAEYSEDRWRCSHIQGEQVSFFSGWIVCMCTLWNKTHHINLKIVSNYSYWRGQLMPGRVNVLSNWTCVISTHQERLRKNSFLRAPKDLIMTRLLILITTVILSNILNYL